MENRINLKSALQVAEVSISYSSKIKNSERPKIGSAKDVFNLLQETWDQDKIDLLEQFKILLLNKGNRVIGLYEVSSGSVSGTLADPKLIFATAIKACASGIILTHNHPSGNLKPSNADIALTRRIKAGGELLDIAVLDHVIISSEGFCSLVDEGFVF
ncbi:JAB domain-containing protein [Pelobium manganitolerans]|uniref:JAB domain-containing protein n=1 Tax=Pelobium manganitolerans TaxID=1842495 RepID=UPI003FA386C2